MDWRLTQTPYDYLVLSFRARQYHAFRNPHDRDDRYHPRGEKRNRHADHAQTPHDCAGALRQGAAQRGEQAALLRNDIALAVNLNRDVSGRAGFVDLCRRCDPGVAHSRSQLCLTSRAIASARVILHRHPERNVCHFAPIRIATKRRAADAAALLFGQCAKLLCLFVHR